MITEKQVEHVIIPMPFEHFLILIPNLIIIFLTIILIVFYIHQHGHIRKRLSNIHYDIPSISSLPNIASNSHRKSLTKSLINFQQQSLSQL